MSEKKISCIVPAFNEAPRIGAVLSIVENHPLLLEVIVVDDGSNDETGALVARDFPSARLITQPENRGKSAAVAIGIAASSGEFIMLLDADLSGLTREDISALAEPVLKDEADMTFSLRKNEGPLFPLLGISFITGERVFRKSLIEKHLDTLSKLPGFGIEPFLNRLLLKGNFRPAVVAWPNVEHRYKIHKRGYFEGIIGEFILCRDILKTTPLLEVLEQNYLLIERKNRAKTHAIMRSPWNPLSPSKTSQKPTKRERTR